MRIWHANTKLSLSGLAGTARPPTRHEKGGLGLLAIPRLLKTRKLKVQILRSFLLLSSTAFNFLALRHLRLDQTTTIGF